MSLKVKQIRNRIRRQGIEKTQQEIVGLTLGLSQLSPGELTSTFAGELLTRVSLLREALIDSLVEQGYDPQRFEESAKRSFWRKK